MEENITSSMQEDFGVKLIRRQNKDRAGLERSTFAMPSDKAEILSLLPLLTEEERVIILGSIKSLLSAKELFSAPPASIGQ